MRILHVISSLGAGGAEVYVRDLSIEMVRSGHHVAVAYISAATSLGASCQFESEFKTILVANGIDFFEVGHACRRFFLRGGLRLRRILNEFQPDVVHSHLYFGILFKVLSFVRTPLVYTHHNHRLGKGGFFYPVFNIIVNRYIGISVDCAEAIASAGAKNVAVIYNGVNPQRLCIKENYPLNDEKVKVMSVGSLCEQKNFGLLLQSFSKMFDRCPDLRRRVSLRIAGEGPLMNDLRESIINLNLSDCINLLGNRRDIPQLLADSDLFVMSSKWEGLPIALLEAMMTGLPVVVTDVGGCRDVVDACGAGLVVPPNDATRLSEALETLICDAAKRSSISITAKRAAKTYSISTACEKHLIVYNSIVQQ